MLIRSQDKTWLVPLNRPICVSSDGSNSIYMPLLGRNVDKPVFLGKYESEKRCLEILDEIQDELKVYQMPEK